MSGPKVFLILLALLLVLFAIGVGLGAGKDDSKSPDPNSAGWTRWLKGLIYKEDGKEVKPEEVRDIDPRSKAFIDGAFVLPQSVERKFRIESSKKRIRVL